MKRFIQITLLILICTRTDAQAWINGKILNAKREKIFLLQPINGFYNDLLFLPEFEIRLDSNNHFNRQLNLQKNAVVKLFVGLRPFWFYIEPGDSLDISLDMVQLKEYELNDALKITGHNSEGNLLFNKMNYQPGKKLGIFENYLDSFHFHRIHYPQAIKLALDKVLAPFYKLQAESLVSQGFTDNIITGLRDELITRIPRRYLFQYKSNNNANLDFLKRMYSIFPPSKITIQSSPFGSSISLLYYQTIAAYHYPTMDFRDSIIYRNHKRFRINSNLVTWMYAPVWMQETMWAISLISLKQIFSDSYDQKDVEAFLALHPNSPMKPYLQPPYFGFGDPVTQKIDSSLIILVDNTKFKTIADIQDHFKGKPLLIDMWASWCVPCKREFLLNPEVDSFCRANNIQRLYLSIDIPVYKAAHLKNVYSYNLKGYHIRAEESLFKDIQKIFYADNPNEISIPRYILISKNGNIISDNIPAPSSGAFYETVLSLLEKPTQ
jgi:thiol-disulfide isomerase/thioredoxin